MHTYIHTYIHIYIFTYLFVQYVMHYIQYEMFHIVYNMQHVLHIHILRYVLYDTYSYALELQASPLRTRPRKMSSSISREVDK